VIAAAPAAAASSTGLLLETLGVAVAVVDRAEWGVRYANARFREWFPAVGGEAGGLAERLPAADLERARERLARGRPYRCDVEVPSPTGALAVQVEMRGEHVAGHDAVVVEATSIARQREAEYMLDSYSAMMERQARDLEKEHERAEKLLLNVMPRGVYEELKEFGVTTPQSFPSASVLLLDFVRFTEMALHTHPGALIAELNDVFTSLDRIVDHFRCERLKTIGDAYMAVGGVPGPDPDHARNLAHAALRMRRFLERRNESSAHEWQCRIGIGVGPAIGAIVGIQKYVYDLFGPAVNVAARREAAAEPMQILVCGETREHLRDDFLLRPLGEIHLKGFGPREVYALEDVARPGR
jgi:adenylate cyclase